MLFEIIPLKTGNYALLEGYIDPLNPFVHPRGTVRIRSCDQSGKILQYDDESTHDHWGSGTEAPSFDVIVYPNGEVVAGRANVDSEEQVDGFKEEIKQIVLSIVTEEVREEAHEEAVIAEALAVDSLLDMLRERVLIVERELTVHNLQQRYNDRREELEHDNFARLRAAIARKFKDIKEAGEPFPDKE